MTKLHLIGTENPALQTYNMVELYRDINQRLKKLTKDETEIKRQLVDGYFFNHEEFIWDGKLLLTYTPRIRNDIDRDKLEKEYPFALHVVY